MKTVQGIKIIEAGVAYVEDKPLLMGKVAIKHNSVEKDKGLNNGWKVTQVEYVVDLEGQSLETWIGMGASDYRIYMAELLRRTNPEFVESLKGKTFTVAELEAEIALNSIEDMDEAKLLGMYKKLQAIAKRKGMELPE